MIRFIFPIVTIASIMTMGACSGSRDPVADNADNASASQAEVDVLPPDESDSTPANELDAGVDDASASPVQAAPGKIPASLHGRWGMTPADCTSTRGDAKGLLIVSADGLKFYESVAKPAGELKTSGTIRQRRLRLHRRRHDLEEVRGAGDPEQQAGADREQPDEKLHLRALRLTDQLPRIHKP